MSAETIAGALRLPPPRVRDHLAQLARERRACVHRHREVERHFPIPGPERAERELISLVRERGPRKILDALVVQGMLPVASLASSLNIAPQATRHYVQRLRAAGLVMSVEDAARSTTLLAPAKRDDLDGLLCVLDEPHDVDTLAQGGDGADAIVPDEAVVRQSPRGPRVLLVDDDAQILDMLTSTIRLARPDLHVVTASSAEEALDLARRARADREPFALVITDHKMGRMTGARLIVTLEAEGLVHAGILMSGSPSNRTLLRGMGSGAAFIAKPFQVDRLLKLIELAIGR